MFNENIIILYLLHHYQNASFQDRQIQCRMDQILVSHVDKDMVEQSHTTHLASLENRAQHSQKTTYRKPRFPIGQLQICPAQASCAVELASKINGAV